MNFVRNLSIVFGLAIVSFAAGFFIISRMTPGGAKDLKPDDSNPGVATAAGIKNADTAVKPSSALPTRVLKPSNLVDAAPGPSLGPANNNPGSQEPQKPRSIDDGSLVQNGTTDTVVPNPLATAEPVKPVPVRKHRRKHKKRPAAAPTQVADSGTADSSDTSAASDPTTVDTSSETIAPAKPAKRRHRRISKPAATDNADKSDAQSNDSKSDTNSNTSTDGGEKTTLRSRSGLYHVRHGISYRTQSDALKAVKSAKARGFIARISPLKHRQHVIYRVQYGAFRDKAKAVAVQQKLNDSQISASVTD